MSILDNPCAPPTTAGWYVARGLNPETGRRTHQLVLGFNEPVDPAMVALFTDWRGPFLSSEVAALNKAVRDQWLASQ